MVHAIAIGCVLVALWAFCDRECWRGRAQDRGAALTAARLPHGAVWRVKVAERGGNGARGAMRTAQGHRRHHHPARDDAHLPSGESPDRWLPPRPDWLREPAAWDHPETRPILGSEQVWLVPDDFIDLRNVA